MPLHQSDISEMKSVITGFALKEKTEEILNEIKNMFSDHEHDLPVLSYMEKVSAFVTAVASSNAEKIDSKRAEDFVDSLLHIQDVSTKAGRPSVLNHLAQIIDPKFDEMLRKKTVRIGLTKGDVANLATYFNLKADEAPLITENTRDTILATCDEIEKKYEGHKNDPPILNRVRAIKRFFNTLSEVKEKLANDEITVKDINNSKVSRITEDFVNATLNLSDQTKENHPEFKALEDIAEHLSKKRAFTHRGM